MTPRDGCPQPHVLQLFLLGRVPGPEADALERHLATCDGCATTLLSLSADDDPSRGPRDATAAWEDDRNPGDRGTALIGGEDGPPAADPLLSKDPAGRPPSARAVVEEVRRIEDAGRGPSRRAWLAGAGAVLAAAGATWVATRPRTDPPADPPPADPGEVAFASDEADPRVALRRGDEPERVVDPRAERVVALPPGDYAVRPVVAAENRVLWPTRVVVKSGERQAVPLQFVGEAGKHLDHKPHPVRGLVVLQRKDRLAVLSAGEDGTLIDWDPTSAGRPRRSGAAAGPFRSAALAPDGRTLAVGSGDTAGGNAVRFYDPDTFEPRKGELICDSQVNALAYSPDGRWLVTGGNDGTLTVWDPRTEAVEVERDQAHPGGVFAVVFRPGGDGFLSVGGDGVLKGWAVAGLKLMNALKGHAGAVRGLAVLPDGKRAVTAGADKTVRVWDLTTRAETTRPVPEIVSALAVSPDGARLLTGDAAGDPAAAVRLWDLGTGEQLLQFVGHPKGVTAAAFAPDGKRAVTAGLDGAVRLWQLPK